MQESPVYKVLQERAVHRGKEGFRAL